jgi:hypothetical protein
MKAKAARRNAARLEGRTCAAPGGCALRGRPGQRGRPRPPPPRRPPSRPAAGPPARPPGSCASRCARPCWGCSGRPSRRWRARWGRPRASRACATASSPTVARPAAAPQPRRAGWRPATPAAPAPARAAGSGRREGGCAPQKAAPGGRLSCAHLGDRPQQELGRRGDGAHSGGGVESRLKSGVIRRHVVACGRQRSVAKTGVRCVKCRQLPAAAEKAGCGGEARSPVSIPARPQRAPAARPLGHSRGAVWQPAAAVWPPASQQKPQTTGWGGGRPRAGRTPAPPPPAAAAAAAPGRPRAGPRTMGARSPDLCSAAAAAASRSSAATMRRRQGRRAGGRPAAPPARRSGGSGGGRELREGQQLLGLS